MFGDCNQQTADWYTVCGLPHSRYSLWLAATAGLAVTGSLGYAYALRDREVRTKQD